MSDILNKYIAGKLTREEIGKVFTPQQLAKKLKKLGYSHKTHVMTNKGFISKSDSVWKDIHLEYLENKISATEIGERYGWSASFTRTFFQKLGFPKKSKEQIYKSNVTTCQRRYNVDNPSQLEVVKKKKEAACMKKYGVKNPSHSPEVLQKIKETTLKNHGVSSYLEVVQPLGVKKAQDPLVKEKRQATLREKGFDFSNPAYQKKIQDNFKEKYKVENPMHMEEKLKKEGYELLEEYKYLQKKEGNIHIEWKKYKIKHIACNTIFKDDVYRLPRCPKCYPLNKKRSFLEYRLTYFIKEHGFNVEHKTNFLKQNHKTYDVDLYIPEKEIAIECNGLYYHSIHPMKNNSVFDKYYHQNKSDLALDKGIKLYHLWEHHDLDLMKSFVKNILNISSNKIGARQCVIQEISVLESKKFLEENHFFSSTTTSLRLGLFFKETLLQVITFKKSGRRTIDIARFATKKDYQVMGGFSKLLKQAIKLLKTQGYNKIFSYCHRDFSPVAEDTVYFKNGFKLLGLTQPSLFFTDFKRIYNRQKFQKHKLKELFPSTFNPKLTAFENLSIQKIFPLYNSGNWRFEKTI